MCPLFVVDIHVLKVWFVKIWVMACSFHQVWILFGVVIIPKAFFFVLLLP